MTMDWLEFISSIVQALISWPIALFVIVLILRRPLSLALRDLKELGFKGFGAEIQATLEKVQERQEVQQHDINVLRWLVGHFLTDTESYHLLRLNTSAPYPFRRSSDLISDLRRLRDIGLIE